MTPTTKTASIKKKKPRPPLKPTSRPPQFEPGEGPELRAIPIKNNGIETVLATFPVRVLKEEEEEEGAMNLPRRFEVWADALGERLATVIEMPAGATDKECEAACWGIIDDLHRYQGGWKELNSTPHNKTRSYTEDIMQKHEAKKIRQTARNMYELTGTLEINLDADVVWASQGAYVQAWVYVPDICNSEDT